MPTQPPNIFELLSNPEVSRDHKLAELKAHVNSHRALPDGCDWIWKQGFVGSEPDHNLLIPLLTDLDNAAVSGLLSGFVTSQPSPELLRAALEGLVQVCEHNRQRRLALIAVLDHYKLPRTNLITAIRNSRTLRDRLSDLYPPQQPGFPRLLTQVMLDLPEDKDYESTLDVLISLKSFLNTEQKRLAGWMNLRRDVRKLRDGLGSQSSGIWGLATGQSKNLIKTLGPEIATSATWALPLEDSPHDTSGEQRAERICSFLCSALRISELPEALQAGIYNTFAGQAWDAKRTPPSKSPTSGPSNKPQANTKTNSTATSSQSPRGLTEQLAHSRTRLISIALIMTVGVGLLVGIKLWSGRVDAPDSATPSKIVQTDSNQENTGISRPANDPDPPQNPNLVKKNQPTKVDSPQKTDPDQVQRLVTQNVPPTDGHAAGHGAGNSNSTGSNNTSSDPKVDPNKEPKPVPMPKTQDNKQEADKVAAVTPKNPPDNNNTIPPRTTEKLPATVDKNKPNPKDPNAPSRFHFQPNIDGFQVAFAPLPPFLDEKLIVAELPQKKPTLELKLLGFEHAYNRLGEKLFSVSITKDDSDRPVALDVMHPGKDSQGSGSRSLCTIEIKDGLATFQWHRSDAPRVEHFVEAIRGCVLQIKYGSAGNKDSWFVALLPPKRRDGPLTLDIDGNVRLTSHDLDTYFQSAFVVPRRLRLQSAKIDQQFTFNESRSAPFLDVQTKPPSLIKSAIFQTGATIEQYENGKVADWTLKLTVQTRQQSSQEISRLNALTQDIKYVAELNKAAIDDPQAVIRLSKLVGQEVNSEATNLPMILASGNEKLAALKKEQVELKAKPKADRDAFLASGLKVSGEFYRIVGGHIESSKVNGGIAVLAFTIPDAPGAAPPMTPQAPTASPTQAQPMAPPDPNAVAPNPAPGNTTIPIPAANPQKVNPAGI